MHQRKSKKILIYFFLLILVGSINNNSINNLKLEKVKKINIFGLEKNDQKIILYKLNNLDLKNIDNKKFPLVNIIKKIPNKDTLFETVIVSTNDVLVNLFLEKKIKYNDIINKMLKIINNKEFIKFKKKYPKNVSDIIELSKYVRLKVLEKVYKN